MHSQSSPQLAQRCLDLGYQPVPINNGKFLRRDDTARVQYSPSAWEPGETVAIRTGRQSDGLYLVRLDFDKHADYQDPIARLNDLEVAIGSAAYQQLVIIRSTGGLGRDVVFKTPVPVRTSSGSDDGLRAPDGTLAGELFGEGRNGRINVPNDPRRWLQGNIETIPTLDGHTTSAILSFFQVKSDKAQSTPTHHIQSRASQKDGIQWIKANVNLVDYLVQRGAKLASSHGNNAVLHCFCQKHAHGDRTPSLSVTVNRDGYLVVFGKSPACLFSTSKPNDIINAIAICESLSNAEILKKYGKPLDTETQRSALPVAPQAQVCSSIEQVSDQPTENALRKRTERAERRDTRLDTIRAIIEATQNAPARAVALAKELLSEGTLQSRSTNNDLAKRLGVAKLTVQRAFRDMELLGWGKRWGGFSPTKHNPEVGYSAAVWTWVNSTANQQTEEQGDTLKTDHAALSDTLRSSTNLNSFSACEEEKSALPAATVAAITANTLSRPELAHIIRAYLAGIEQGKRASRKQAIAYVEDNAPGAFTKDLITDVYERLIPQRKWDLATRDIPTMTWQELKREGARARGMAAKCIKNGENPQYFIRLADRFDQEINERIQRGEAPEHYRRRKAKPLPEPTPIEVALADDNSTPDFPSSQAPVVAADTSPFVAEVPSRAATTARVIFGSDLIPALAARHSTVAMHQQFALIGARGTQ